MRLFLRCLGPAAVVLVVVLWPAQAAAQVCNHTIPAPQTLDFGTTSDVPLTQIDATLDITVTCTVLVPARVCVFLSAATWQMTSGGATIAFELRSQSGGALWTPANPAFVDIPAGTSVEAHFTVYGRVPSGQTPAAFGTFTSGALPIQVRAGLQSILGLPDCALGLVPSLSGPGSFTTSLTVQPTCSVDATDLGFGTATSLAVSIPASTNLSVTCSATAPYHVLLDDGTADAGIAARRMRQGADSIAYQLYRDGGHTLVFGDTQGVNSLAGTGTGSPQSIPVYGLVPAQGAKPTGTYSDTITVTLTF